MRTLTLLLATALTYCACACFVVVALLCQSVPLPKVLRIHVRRLLQVRLDHVVLVSWVENCIFSRVY